MIPEKSGTCFSIIKRGKIELLNYTSLDNKQLEIVLEWRNNPEVNKWLIDRNQISWKNHMVFVEKLRHSQDIYYWLVKYDALECGVVSLHIDSTDMSGLPGIFIAPEYLGYGIGIEIAFEFTHIIFETKQIKSSKGIAYKANKNAMDLNRMLGYQFSPCTHDNNLVNVHLSTNDYQNLPKDFNEFIKSHTR